MGAEGSSAGGERLHGLDAVRSFALIGGVALHATMSFFPSQQVWIVKDTGESAVLGLVFYVLHIFRMALFFLLAGYFGRLLLQRRGAGGFVKDRARRILAPLLIFWPIVFPLIVACLIWAVVQASGGKPLPREASPASPFTLEAFPVTHLWFLYILVLLYAGWLALRAPVVVLDRGGGLRRLADHLVAPLTGWVGPVLLAVPVAAVMASDPKWLPWFGVRTPDTGLIPNLQALTTYGLAFGVGWMAHRAPQTLERWRARWPATLALAAATTAACLWLIGPEPRVTPFEAGEAALPYAGAYAVALWSWTFGLIGLGLAAFSRRSAVRRWIADSSYWVYIAHLPLVMALQVWIAPLAWPAWVKFPLVLTAALALLFGSYQLLVRHSFVGALLNGRRRARQPAPTAVPAPSI